MGKYTEDLGTRIAMSRIGQAKLEQEFKQMIEALPTWTDDNGLHLVNEAQMTRDEATNVHWVELQASNHADVDLPKLTRKFNDESGFSFVWVRFIPEIPALELP